MDDRLQKFTAVVECGSFTRAATKLHISQPALSVAVGKLERSYGIELFDRSEHRKIALTEAGEAVYEAALEHRAVDENLSTTLPRLKNRKITIRLGLIDSMAAVLCGSDEPLASLEKSTELSLEVMNSAGLCEAVQGGRLDMAIVVKQDQLPAGLTARTIGYDEMVAVCAPRHRQAYASAITAGWKIPFVSYMPTSLTYAYITHALESMNIATQPVLQSTSPDVMLSMVLRGSGAAVLPYVLVCDDLASGKLVTLDLKQKPIIVRRALSFVTISGRKLPVELKNFERDMEILLEGLSYKY